MLARVYRLFCASTDIFSTYIIPTIHTIHPSFVLILHYWRTNVVYSWDASGMGFVLLFLISKRLDNYKSDLVSLLSKVHWLYSKHSRRQFLLSVCRLKPAEPVRPAVSSTLPIQRCRPWGASTIKYLATTMRVVMRTFVQLVRNGGRWGVKNRISPGTGGVQPGTPDWQQHNYLSISRPQSRNSNSEYLSDWFSNFMMIDNWGGQESQESVSLTGILKIEAERQPSSKSTRV